MKVILKLEFKVGTLSLNGEMLLVLYENMGHERKCIIM